MSNIDLKQRLVQMFSLSIIFVLCAAQPAFSGTGTIETCCEDEFGSGSIHGYPWFIPRREGSEAVEEERERQERKWKEEREEEISERKRQEWEEMVERLDEEEQQKQQRLIYAPEARALAKKLVQTHGNLHRAYPSVNHYFRRPQYAGRRDYRLKLLNKSLKQYGARFVVDVFDVFGKNIKSRNGLTTEGFQVWTYKPGGPDIDTVILPGRRS